MSITYANFERAMENLPWKPGDADDQAAWLAEHGVEESDLKRWVIAQVEEDVELLELPHDPHYLSAVAMAYHMGFIMGYRLRAEA